MIGLQHRHHLGLGMIGGPIADPLGQRRGRQSRFDSQAQGQRMNRATPTPKGFVKPAPKGNRAKERGHGDWGPSPPPVEPTGDLDATGGHRVSLGLKLIESPCHDPPSHLAKQVAQLAFKVQGTFRSRLVLDEPLDEPSTPSEGA